jgi:hypothetical protein
LTDCRFRPENIAHLSRTLAGSAQETLRKEITMEGSCVRTFPRMLLDKPVELQIGK